MKEFTIKSGSMILSDPCYERGIWCQGFVPKVKNGRWVAEVEFIGNRVSRLMAKHENAYDVRYSNDVEHNGQELDFNGGVDSGQFGYFDSDEYENNESVKDIETNLEGFDDCSKFYQVCCDKTLSKDSWGVLPGGVVSSTGYGDGSYITYGQKNGDNEYVAFTTIFIEEDELEDEIDEVEDEDIFN